MKLPRKKIHWAAALSLVLSGCELMGPQMTKKLPIQPIASIEDRQSVESTELDPLANNEANEQETVATAEIYPGTGKFINNKSARSGSTPAKGQYTLNFDDADLGEVAKVILGETLDANYILSPRVAGKVTLQTTRALTKEELIPTLEMLLRMNGAVLIKDKGLYRIEPAAQALRNMSAPKLALRGQKIPTGFQLRLIPLQYIGVQEMQKILAPLLPPKGVIRADVARNLLMVAGTAQELERILETVAIFDVDWIKGMSVGLYTLRNVEVATVITELEKIFGKNGKSPLAGMFRLTAIERLNAVMVITPQPKYLEEARIWVDRLDRTSGETTASGSVHVYRVQNVDAKELADTMNEIFSGKKRSKTPKSSLAPGLKRGKVAGKKRLVNNRSRNNTSLSNIGDVRIIADEPNNSLIIVSTAREYEVIESVLKQLDAVPLQVLIDATIVEITLTDNLEYGLKWFLTHGDKGTAGGSRGGVAGLGGITVQNMVDTVTSGAAGGFSYGFLSSRDRISAVLSLLADESMLNVISAPSLMVLNNQEATIQVGDEVPIRTSDTITTGGSQVNSFQRLKTGVTLKVKPRVNSGGLVIMEIEQKISNAKAGSTVGLPTIAEREIQSTIAVQSGDSIALGGLITDNRNDGKNGIPILHKLPLVGPLFGSTKKSQDRTELLVLITPRVVKNRHDALDITNQFKRKLTGLYEDMPNSNIKLEMTIPDGKHPVAESVNK